MKPSLRTIAKRDHAPRSPRKRRGVRARRAEQAARVAAAPPTSVSPSTSPSDHGRTQPELAAQQPDLAAQRVREAGGPLDRASYTCQCGYLFAAAVSATVECPHCGTSQAW
jgi:hypothetical protein